MKRILQEGNETTNLDFSNPSTLSSVSPDDCYVILVITHVNRTLISVNQAPITFYVLLDKDINKFTEYKQSAE